MPGFLFTFLAVLLAGVGARDQVIVAGLSARLGARGSLLTVAVLTATIASTLAAWGAAEMAPHFNSRARMLLAAMALGLAGLEALVLRAPKAPKEPTRSLFAAAIVLFAHQITDSARFITYAMAMATMSPVTAAIGGAAGSAGALVAGWLGAEDMLRPEIGALRKLIGLVLLLAAGWTVLLAFDKI